MMMTEKTETREGRRGCVADRQWLCAGARKRVAHHFLAVRCDDVCPFGLVHARVLLELVPAVGLEDAPPFAHLGVGLQQPAHLHEKQGVGRRRRRKKRRYKVGTPTA